MAFVLLLVGLSSLSASEPQAASRLAADLLTLQEEVESAASGSPIPGLVVAIREPDGRDLVTGVGNPIIQKGFIPVPESPGLGIELNEDVVKEHLRHPGYFEPTPQFDKYIIDDFRRGGPYPHIDEHGNLVNEM